MKSPTASGSKSALEQHFYDNFKTIVASSEQDGYTPYWLGTEFKAGELTFTGPAVSDLPGRKVEGGGATMSYHAPTSNGGAVILDLWVYSQDAWQKVRATREGPTAKLVTVAGQEAKLFLLEGGTRPIGQARLVLTFGNTTVLAIANSGGAATPGGPDMNPLIDEATFIAAMQNLRRYPE